MYIFDIFDTNSRDKYISYACMYIQFFFFLTTEKIQRMKRRRIKKSLHTLRG